MTFRKSNQSFLAANENIYTEDKEISPHSHAEMIKIKLRHQ